MATLTHKTDTHCVEQYLAIWTKRFDTFESTQINFELLISIYASELKSFLITENIPPRNEGEQRAREKESVDSEQLSSSFFCAHYMCQTYQMDMNHWTNIIIKFKRKTCRTISIDSEQILRLECELKHVVRALNVFHMPYQQIYVLATN